MVYTLYRTLCEALPVDAAMQTYYHLLNVRAAAIEGLFLLVNQSIS
jgi:hypothetical protein